jgi:hypothetical protein
MRICVEYVTTHYVYETVHIRVHVLYILQIISESIATLPPFGPIEGQKWFDQISRQ